jgi:predicted tellurium resistance membrane protein TerC
MIDLILATLPALLTLTALEIILGFDNLVIIAILTEKLSAKQRPAARRLGLGFALITRVMLLSLAFFTAQLSAPFYVIGDFGISARDVLLLAGGAFLIWKAWVEIRELMTSKNHANKHKLHDALVRVVIQIALMDIVFSFDTVMTAIGLARDLWVMIAAICIAMAAMVWAVDGISNFINRHLRIKILALTYMLLIGAVLLARAAHIEIPDGYIYSALGFSVLAEMVQMGVAHQKNMGRSRAK